MGAVGSPLFRFMAHCRGLPPAPITRAPSPQGAGSQKFRGRKTAPSWLPPHCPKDYSLLARGGLARSGALPFAQRSYAGQHYAPGGERSGLRFAQPSTITALRFAAALLRCASLSIAPPRSLDQKAVFGTATQSQDYLCGVGFALRLASSWVLLGRGRLSLPAVALPLSPSLASPPPSLRSGTSPAGGFMCLFRVCVPPFRHRLRRSLHIGTHKSGWVRFCAVWASPSAGRSANIG